MCLTTTEHSGYNITGQAQRIERVMFSVPFHRRLILNLGGSEFVTEHRLYATRIVHLQNVTYRHEITLK